MNDANPLVADPFRNAFLQSVLSKDGLPYCWPTKENRYSGKGLKGALYQDCFDCSGVVTHSLWEATNGALDWRSTMNAYLLMRRLPETHEPIPGDLAFYGAGRNMVSHVMVVLGEKDRDLQVFGACGGNHHTTSPEIAKKTGARVRLRKSHLYRPDFLGFGQLLKDVSNG